MPRLHVNSGVTTALPQRDKALPQLPASPTLTNPDYILPSGGLSALHSPPRVSRRPPSPSYLRDESPSPKTAAMARKDKHPLGLMSRKMLLLRSRSSGSINDKISPLPRSSYAAEFMPEEPVLQDVGNLAPEQSDYLRLPDSDRRSASGGSSSSDISGMTTFLADYGNQDSTSDDEVLEESGTSPAAPRANSIVDLEADDELDAERRKQQQEEYNSAILSKRAEQILANAKKRLNVMEGNLRGARDLVAPLTAANLKRATSLGSARYTNTYGRRQVANGYEHNEQSQQQPSHKLQPQSSSPAMGRDYQGRARGFSEADLPERPYTALDQAHHLISRNVRTPVRSAELSPAKGLRGSRSHDSLASGGMMGYGGGRERALHARDSPDSNHLETLQEADERKSTRNSGNGVDQFSNNGLGIYRPSSRTSDLREQMSSLKGKISSLKDRAREDSLKRQSRSNLRNASPFNNALAAAPEFFYTSSTGNGSPVLETNAGMGWTSNSDSSSSPIKMWEGGTPRMGGRNALAEHAGAQDEHAVRQARVVEIGASKTPDSKFQVRPTRQTPSSARSTHRRTASGTAIINSANNRYSHHQPQPRAGSQNVPGTYLDEDEHSEMPHRFASESSHSSPPSESWLSIDHGYAPSEDEESIYEDAQDEQNTVVAHEDREDAFDYEHFFLHSAMGTYSGNRRGSDASDTSASSAETAKGPALAQDDEEGYALRHSSGTYPPPTPVTPERLREIERNLHKRALSNESITTLDTFATAEEDPVSPMEESGRAYGFDERRAVSPMLSERSLHSDFQNATQLASRIEGRPISRPGTAVRHAAHGDSSSDRADSGVALSRRSTINTDRIPSGTTMPRPQTARSPGSQMMTPPTSPRGKFRQDPITVAVNALLDPDGRPLGLRNKAVLFGVMESLRQVVQQLQQADDTQYESRLLRRRLDGAKLCLDSRDTG